MTLSDQAAILKLIPRDAHTVLSRFEIEPDIVPFTCCPKCFTTYPPDFSAKLPYPNKCTFQSMPGADVCGASLLKTKETSDSASIDEAESIWSGEPIKLYSYQRMSAWLARLFARPELKDYMTHAWDQKSDGEHWTDIWDTPALHEIKGPDGKSFSIQPPGSVYLVFSLFTDWFNPYGNKQAGKSHSTGAIYMICLNLPPELRFKLENIYLVGIIPGPKEPSLDEINHFL